MGSTASNKPLILICCTPIYGHSMPIRAIGKELIARGYEVTFVTGSSYRSIIESIGASFVPLSGYGDFTEEDFPRRWPIRETLLEGPVQLTFDMEEIFLKSLTSQHEAEQTALKILSDKYSGRPIIVVTESAYLGSLPTAAGAPGVQPAATLGIGIVPVVISSIDHPPFGPGLPPDSTPEGRERNKAMNESIQKQFLAQPNSTFRKLLAELGATDPDIPLFFDAMYMLPNRFLQMCIPSIEYPRSDLPESIRFAGGLPKGHRDTYANPPSWWDEIVANNTKKIVLVSQGTLTLNFTDLVLPTLTGLKDREDVLVVVALGKEGRALPEGTTVPANARIADFIPFDDVLPYCAVFVSNGGYGALQHAISHGVPLVMGGTTEDKPEIAARAEWAGIAVNMRTATPSPEVVLAAVDEIFSNPKYKERAKVLEAEMATFDPMEIVVKNIEELAAGKP